MHSRAFVTLPLILLFGLGCTADSAAPADAELAFSVAEHDFGDVMLGTSSDTLRVILVNRGAVRTGVVTVAVSGAQAADFTVVRDLCTGTNLRSGGTCVVVVRLAPTAARASEAVLRAEVPGGVSVSVTLRGNGREAGLRLLPGPSMAFGELPLGTSRAMRITVQNTGAPTGALTTEITGPDAASFAITDNGCVGHALAFMQTCEMGIRFTPNATGAREASLIVASPGSTVTGRLLGTSGINSGLSAQGPLDFGLQRTSVSSTARMVTFRNSGPETTGLLQTLLSGPQLDFVVSQDACSGRLLGVGETCGISMRFRPTETGSRSATITVSDNKGASATAALLGTGATVVFSVAPSVLDFGARMVGLAPIEASLVVTNIGAVRSDLVSGVVTCEPAGWDYGCEPESTFVVPGTCGPIDPGGSCTLTVRFEPSVAGSWEQSLFVADGLASVVTTLRGTGTGLQPSTLSITFPAIATEVPSSTVAVVVTNTSNQTTGPVATTVTSGFEVVSQDCGHAILFPGRTCTVVLRAAPHDVPGTVFGQLIVQASPGGVARTSLSVVVQ